MAQIELTRGKLAIIDDADLEMVSALSWSLQTTEDGGQYARSFYRGDDGREAAIGMGRFIMGAAKGLFIDHINGDGLDNRRQNLRECTPVQNSYNRRKRATSSSRFKGVSFCKRPNLVKRWKSQIRVNGILLHLGYYRTEEDAARAYDAAAMNYFGEFSKTNGA